MSSLTLNPDELAELCPDIRQPAAMVRHLHSEGFVRARLRAGKVILERSHYEAVCRGEFDARHKPGQHEPKLRSAA